MLDAKWQIGDEVRLIRTLRNDGTYPGVARGEILVRPGQCGQVVDLGRFLQDQIVYAVHFLESGRTVGCREYELIAADDPWVASRFEAREQVRAARSLVIQGEVVVPMAAEGQVLKVIRTSQPPLYHVHFGCQPGRVFAVPESALDGTGSSASDPEAL
ncbi:nitrogen fixation protein NifZ [Thermochromatium tepidum]|uniref:Nitrogen fixation protein NifZ n=1 Tax=Thermochromatium tepidum ATCC 43061 TaxID=316276 RepID=A0A6I6E953_THETI|nr:nitrogen fixation protein NifZ [Thermochromatium tepidum]QGU33203.1 nitrogen fixation protein NifZ [Thermochromatium tepidum ATCC 43061]